MRICPSLLPFGTEISAILWRNSRRDCTFVVGVFITCGTERAAVPPVDAWGAVRRPSPIHDGIVVGTGAAGGTAATVLRGTEVGFVATDADKPEGFIAGIKIPTADPAAPLWNNSPKEAPSTGV